MMKEHFKIPDQMHPTETVDRARRHLPYRISAGLRTDADFQHVQAMLVLTRGCGKWMRPNIYRTASVPIPGALRKNCLQFLHGDRHDAESLTAIAADLSTVQVQAVNLLLSGSLKVLDNVLMVCVEDPGLWLTDFDGKSQYHSLCDPERLAEQTGLSVIDALPARDLIVGGKGFPLTPLPNWILFADRDEKIATRSRLLVQIDDWLELTYLPPSDGLDAELPAIRYLARPGLRLINGLLKLIGGKSVHDDDEGHLAVQGKLISRLLEFLEVSLTEVTGSNTVDRKAWKATDQAIELVVRTAKENQYLPQDVLCTVNHFLARQIQQFMQRFQRTKHNERAFEVNELIFAGQGANNGFLRRLLATASPEIRQMSSNEFGIDENHVRLATSCVLGLTHIDQLPANLPPITGAEFPRLLGRLTPGRPANWRRLLLEMADYRPPTMKLREAV